MKYGQDYNYPEGTIYDDYSIDILWDIIEIKSEYNNVYAKVYNNTYSNSTEKLVKKFAGGIINENGKYGYIDENMNMTIPAIYNGIYDLTINNESLKTTTGEKFEVDYSNYLRISNNNGNGIATKQGEILMECQYGNIIYYGYNTFVVTKEVNDNWKFAFESETNQRYARYVTSNGDVRYHEGHDDSDGVIQRVWAEGNIGKLHVDVGRRWRGLGFQNVLLGNETDGVVLDYPLDNNGLKALAFYQKPTDAGYDFGMYGLGIQGPVSKNLQLSLAYAMLDIDKDESPGYDPYNGNVPLVNTFGSHGLVLSAMWNPLPNITLIGDYVRTNAAKERVDEWAPDGTEHIFDIDENESKSIRLNYRWTNLNDPGSFQLYTRWFDYGRHGNIMGDEEWGLLKPGSKGWVFGFKYVPAKNVEWETMYEIADMYDGTYGLKDTQYKRHFIRTQVDFHF